MTKQVGPGSRPASAVWAGFAPGAGTFAAVTGLLVACWLPHSAFAACDNAGLCCAGKDVYVCKADGQADLGKVPVSTCNASGCASVAAMTACASTGTPDWANTAFCGGTCQADCVGSACANQCSPGTTCVYGACKSSGCGIGVDLRPAVWADLAGEAIQAKAPYVLPPSANVTSLCSGRYWSFGIRKDQTLVQWGFQHETQDLFGNAAVPAVKDALQIACSRSRLIVLRDDFGKRSIVGFGKSPFAGQATFQGAENVVAVWANDNSYAYVSTSGPSTGVVVVPPTAGENKSSGAASYLDRFLSAATTSKWVALSGNGYYDAGYIAIRADGTVAVAANRTDGTAWPVQAPAQVAGAVAVAISANYAMALKADGSVVVWDSNNAVVANPAGLAKCKAVAVFDQGIPAALQVGGTIALWNNTEIAKNSHYAALSAAVAKRTGITALDPNGTGLLACVGACGSISDLGCCSGDNRFWCDPTGVLKSEACASGTCGWQTQASHYCDNNCGKPGPNGVCWCDAGCAGAGDCCNAAGTGKAGATCGGSTCGACQGSSAAFTPNVYQCLTSGGSAPGGGQTPLRACICVPNCAGKGCGADGCGGICDGNTCDDGNLCTLGDTCSGSTCAGKPKNCNDGNPCTNDVCNDFSGAATCGHPFWTVPCSDGNACTSGDLCSQGQCLPGGQQPTCSDGNACTDDSCDPGSGCVFKPNSAPCSDSNPCTAGDLCKNGACTVGAQPADCNDGNPCTDDSCVGAGGCTHAANTTKCDDNSSCTTADVCQAGKCSGTGALACDDGNPCTKDDCLDATTCAPKVELGAGTPCNDGSACHLGGKCAAGKCGGFVQADCDDGNPCTSDGCDSKTGCAHLANTLPCSDGNACTVGDACAKGNCLGGPSPCDDGNVCTDDCDPAKGCISKATTGPCDDGSVCTKGDTCVAGKCTGSTTLSCDDGNSCTIDSCNPLLACSHAYSTAACDDGNACTSNDVCWTGICTAGTGAPKCTDGNACTDDTCNPKTGCSFANNTAPCSDGDSCTVGDVCAGGTCASGKPETCNDDNPCTTDTCLKAKGCVYANNGLACDDGQACTGQDTCSGGVCKGKAGGCNDQNPCTDDACTAAGACVHNANTLGCDDGDPCTTGDTCTLGACKGPKPACDDGNPCTTDTCTVAQFGGVGPLFGKCKYTKTPFAGACNDGNPCTTADSCDADGNCSGAPVCLDGSTCVASAGLAQCTCPAGLVAKAKGAYTGCCKPNCAGKACGSDGCGGVCGKCSGDDTCSADGATCVPTVACWGKAPTDHSCCDGRKVQRCQGQASLSVQDCAAVGQFCGWSASKQDYACTNDGIAEPTGSVAFACPVLAAKCVPDCKNRVCGPDGCGGSCGTCGDGTTCDPLKGACANASCQGAVPATRCVENLVWQKFADETVATSYFAKDYPTVTGKDRYFLGCGCKSGKYAPDGACLVDNVAGLAIADLSADCHIRSCKPNPDGSSTVANILDLDCPDGLTWNIDKQRLECPSLGAANKVGVDGKSGLLHAVLLVKPAGSPTAANGTSGTYFAAQLKSMNKNVGTLPKLACGEFKIATCAFPTKRVCGVDDFGATCGSCPAGQACSKDGSACLASSCGTKTCGVDLAGNSCGSCPSGKVCAYDGQCVACAAANPEDCGTKGELNYCTAAGQFSFKCGEVADPVTGAKAQGSQMISCNSVQGLADARTCFVPPTAACDANCAPGVQQNEVAPGSAKSTCSCSSDCEAKGTCCRGWQTCVAKAFTATCGNGKCEHDNGEFGTTCSDCKQEGKYMICGKADLPDAPWSWKTENAGTLAAKAVAAVPAGFDVRPAPAGIPAQGLVAYVPQLGVVVGSPRASVVEQRSDEVQAGDAGKPTALNAADTAVGVGKGVDGDGLVVDGAKDPASGKLRRAALTIKDDGMLRAAPRPVPGSSGGFTVAAWVKLPKAAAEYPSVLGTSQDFGDGDWTNAAAKNLLGTAPTADQLAETGRRPGHSEKCFTSRPGDDRIALDCGGDTIADVDAYWGDAGEQFLPDPTRLFANKLSDLCFEWRRVTRSGVCQDPGIADRLRSACVGKQNCAPGAEVIGANPCQGVAGSHPRLLARALCRAAPAGITLLVEADNGPAACADSGCKQTAQRRLALKVPVAIPNSWDTLLGKGNESAWLPLTLTAGGAVPLDQWFHVAVVFQPIGNEADEDKKRPAGGIFVLYVDGFEAARAYGRAPPVAGWHWGRGYLAGVQKTWPNAWGSQFAPSDPWGNETPFNAVANAGFDELFTYRRALKASEVFQLFNKPKVGLLRTWPALAASEVSAANLWTTGGTTTTVPVELDWLRDPGACSADAKNSGLVRAPFDALRVSPGAKLAMPADGADLDGLSEWTLAAWLRPAEIGAGKVLLDVQQAGNSRVRLETTAACGGRGIRAVFADGAAVAVEATCEHVVAAGQWHHVLISQFAKQRGLSLDGGVLALGAGAGPLFNATTAGARRVIAQASADLGHVSLYRGGKDRTFAAATRTGGPAVWIGFAGGNLASPDGKWTDFANFHNNGSNGPSDAAALTVDSGNLTKAAVALRGRLAANPGSDLPPLSLAFSYLPTGALPADAFWTPALQAGTTTAGWVARARCSKATGSNYECRLWLQRHGSGPAAANLWQSTPVYRGPVAAGSGVPFGLSVDAVQLTARTLVDGIAGAATFAQVAPSGDVQAMLAASGLTAAPSLSYAADPQGRFGDIRVWYGASVESGGTAALGTTCKGGTVADTCAAQLRTCSDNAQAGGFTLFAQCGACQTGYSEIAGMCLPKRQPMERCSVDSECAEGLCNYGICTWASGEADSPAAKACAALGHPVTQGKKGYVCNPLECLADFALKADQLETQELPGFEHLPLCQWSPSVDAGHVCERNTQCKQSGVCASQDETVYRVDPGLELKYNTVSPPWLTALDGTQSLGPNWVCKGLTDGMCATAHPDTNKVGRCLAANQAVCGTFNKDSLAVETTSYTGKLTKGAACTGCLKTTLKDGNGADKPVFTARRDWLEPAACAKIINNYEARADYMPVFQWPELNIAADYWCFSGVADQTGLKFGNVPTRAGVAQSALVKKDLAGNPPGFGAFQPNAAQLNQNTWYGYYGHKVGDVIYAKQVAAKRTKVSELFFDLSQCLYAGQTKVWASLQKAEFVDGDILSVNADLPILGYLLGIDGLPEKSSKLTGAQAKALREAGVGSALFAQIVANEKLAPEQRTPIDLGDCLRPEYKTFAQNQNNNGKFTVTADRKSLSWDREFNDRKCVYNRQVNGTTCPYLTTDTVTAADSMCESSYCAYDTGVCEDGAQEIEEVSGSASNNESPAADPILGPFGVQSSSYSVFRFGKYPKHEIFLENALEGQPVEQGKDSDIAEPTAGTSKDFRHLQTRSKVTADLKLSVPALKGTQPGDLLAGLIDLVKGAPLYETVALSLLHSDFGYTVAPGHKVGPKKVRFAPVLRILGITVAGGDPLKPIEGDACAASTPPACGLAKAGTQAKLACQNSLWSLSDSNCAADESCQESSGSFTCTKKNYMPAINASESCGAVQVQDGQYVPPASGSGCHVARVPAKTSGVGSAISGAAGASLNSPSVPSPNNLTLVDFTFPNLAGDCSLELAIKAGKGAIGEPSKWLQGPGNGTLKQLKEIKACFTKFDKSKAKDSAKALPECIRQALLGGAAVPGSIPLEWCYKYQPRMVGNVPITIKATIAPVLNFKWGFRIDDQTFEPAQFVRPSLGLNLDAAVYFNPGEILDDMQKAGRQLTSTIENVGSFIELGIGLRGKLALIELAFPVTWSVAMQKLSRTVDRPVPFPFQNAVSSASVNLGKGMEIPNLWRVQRLKKVDLELTLLRLSLSWFAKLTILLPLFEMEQELFKFDGFLFRWNLSTDVLFERKVNFDWPGAKL